MGCGGSKHAVDTAATVKKSASKKVNEAEVEKITDNVKPEEPVVAKDDEKASVAVPEVVAAPEDATEERKDMKEEIPVEEESKDVVPVSVPEEKELTPEAKKEEDVVASVAEPEVSAAGQKEDDVVASAAETESSAEGQKEDDVVVASVAETESSAAAKKEAAVVEPIAETEVSAEAKKEEAVVEAVAETQVPVKLEEEKKEEITATESSSTETPKAE